VIWAFEIGSATCDDRPMAHCFCGCGRSVAAVGHKRRANKLGEIITEALPIAGGALERLTQFAGDPELEHLVATGPARVQELSAYVHGDIARADLDGDGLNDWHERWASRYKEVLKPMNDWLGLNPFAVARMVLAGERAQATIATVRDTGVTVNADPRVELLLRVEPAGAPPFEATRKVVVSRIDFPRAGDRLEVAYDPDDLETVTFRKSELKTVAGT
jgi:hypothetical protein